MRSMVSKAPTSSGVYRWLDKSGNVLYVGKAKNLKNRLKSYISPAKGAKLGPWKESLIQKIADLDTTITSSELEALVLETNLIKELKPKYNVLMKDDKNYVYVRVTIQDDFPTVTIERRMEDDKAKYFGPYLSVANTKKTLDLLNSIFPFQACKKSIETLNKGKKTDTEKPCLDYQIGKCCGLCIGKYSKAEFRSIIEDVMGFFKGDHKHVAQEITKQMQEAAVNKKFERAAKLRDVLKYMESLKEQQIVSDTSGMNNDFIGVALQFEKAQVVILRERGGKLIGEMSYALAGQVDTAGSVLAQFLPQYYSSTIDIPDTVIISEQIEDQKTIEKWLNEIRGKKVEVAVPERGKKSKLLQMAEANANAKVQQQLAKWEAAARNVESALKELKKFLGLKDQPKRIEGYDISHHGGTETVGSMVVMKNGKSANDQYRSFTIRTLKEGQVDDYAALKEVLKRRLLYLVRNVKEEEKEWGKRGFKFGKIIKKDQIKIDYTDSLVARKDKEAVSVALLLEPKLGTLELSLHKSDDPDLEDLLIRKLLKNVKKGKVYTVVKSDLEAKYSELGFRHVQKKPEVFSRRKGLVMVYIVSDHKTDKSFSSRPDLMVIDGGKGQLSSVAEVLKDLNLDIPTIGLAKREEEVFMIGHKESAVFPKDSQGKFLLMRLRDEAHRFANAHREKREAFWLKKGKN